MTLGIENNAPPPRTFATSPKIMCMASFQFCVTIKTCHQDILEDSPTSEGRCWTDKFPVHKPEDPSSQKRLVLLVVSLWPLWKTLGKFLIKMKGASFLPTSLNCYSAKVETQWSSGLILNRCKCWKWGIRPFLVKCDNACFYWCTFYLMAPPVPPFRCNVSFEFCEEKVQFRV